MTISALICSVSALICSAEAIADLFIAGHLFIDEAIADLFIVYSSSISIEAEPETKLCSASSAHQHRIRRRSGTGPSRNLNIGHGIVILVGLAAEAFIEATSLIRQSLHRGHDQDSGTARRPRPCRRSLRADRP